MKQLFFIVFLFFIGKISAQETPFQIYIEPLEIPEVGGLQVFAYGQHEGK